MLVKTNGIVINTIKYSETSIVCRIFTHELGLQSYMINGVRTAKGNKAALFRAGNILELVSYFKREHKGLQRLKEYHFAVLYQALPFNIVKSSLAMFMVEVLSKVLKEEEPHPELYEFVEESFTRLDRQERDLSNAHIHFLAGLAQHLGFHPSGQPNPALPYLDLREGAFLAHPPMHQLFLDWPQVSLFYGLPAATITLPQKRHLLEVLLQYFAEHVDHFGQTKSWPILSEVLGASSPPPKAT